MSTEVAEKQKRRVVLKPRALPARFNPGCASLYKTVPKGLRTRISPLLQYLCDRGLTPAAVDDALVSEYRDQLSRWGRPDPASTVSALVRDWNALRALGHGELSPLTPPQGKRQRARVEREALLSARLREELTTIFGMPNPSKGPEARLLYNDLKRIERAAEAAARLGYTIGALADLADVTALRAAIAALYPDADRPCKARDAVFEAIARALTRVGGQAVGLVEVVIDEKFQHPQAGIALGHAASSLASGFTIAKVRAILDAVTADLGRTLGGRPGYDELARARAAIATALTIHNLCPRRTLEGARFVAAEGPDRGRLWGWHGEQDIALEAGIGDDLARGIDAYYAAMTHRLGRPPQTLMDAGRGRAISGSSLSTGVGRLLESLGYPGLSLQRLRDGSNVGALPDLRHHLSKLSDANGYRSSSNFKQRFKHLLDVDASARIEATFERPAMRTGGRKP